MNWILEAKERINIRVTHTICNDVIGNMIMPVIQKEKQASEHMKNTGKRKSDIKNQITAPMLCTGTTR